MQNCMEIPEKPRLRRPILHVLIALLMIGLLLIPTGCGREQKKTGKIHIKFWMFPMWSGVNGTEKDGKPEDWPLYMCKQFQKKHPEVEFDLEMLTWQGGGQKLDLSVLSKTYPDICYLDSNNRAKYASQGVIEPIDSYMTPEDRKDFLPNILETCKYNGHVIMWPWLSNALVLAVNTDVFRERNAMNLLPKGPDRGWTYDEFLKACQKCTFVRNKDGKKTNVYGYALYGIPTSIEYQMLTLVLGYGGNLYNADGSKFTLNSPEGVRGMQFLMDLLDKYKVTPPSPAGMNTSQVGQLFTTQEVAIESTNCSVLQAMRVSVAKGLMKPFHAEIVQPPHLPGKKPTTMLSVGGYLVFKQTDPRKRKLVMEFARFLTSSENAHYLRALGQFPCRTSAGQIYGNDPDMQVVSKLIPLARVYFTRTSPELQPVVNNIYQQIFTHAKTPEQALNDAARDADAIIARDMSEQKVTKK